MKKKVVLANPSSLDQHAPQGRVLLDLPALKQKLGTKSDDTVYGWIRRGLLPRPLKLSRKCSRWDSLEVEAALDRLPRGATGANPVRKEEQQLKAA